MMRDPRRAAVGVSERGSSFARGAAALLVLVACARVAAGDVVGEAPRGAHAARRVLLLSSYGTEYTTLNQVSLALRSELAVTWHDPLEINEITVESASTDDAEREALFVDYLTTLFSTRPIDLVVTLGGPATRFAQRHRERLFHGIPMLLAAVDIHVIDESTMNASDASVPIEVDVPATVEFILQLLPDTEHFALVLGASPIEQFWRDRLGRDLERFEGRVHLIWLDGLSFGEVRDRVAALSPRSAVLFVMLLRDSRGVPYSQARALAAIRQASTAPLFGLFDTQIGQGVVGGRTLPVAEVGTRTAEAVSRLLRGESPAAVRYPPVQSTALVFDGRELEHWGIRESRLPPGSAIRYRLPSPWMRYRWQFFGGVAIVGLQTALIVGLVLHRTRRRSAESEVRQLHGRLLTAYEQERRRLARELHDDVTQRLARLAIDGAQVERLGATPEGVETLRQMRVELARLGHDVHALSRRLHPSILDDLGLAEAVRSEAERLARAGEVAVALHLDGAPERVPAELGLCLFRVAQEALRNVEHHAGAKRIEVALKLARGGVELSVEDDGVGFDPLEIRHREGLGQVSMRERLTSIGGRLSIESAVGQGTTVTAWVPFPEGTG